MSTDQPALELRAITKRFPGVVANDSVDFELRWGEIHALLGENGSGKSTLMKVAYGIYTPDGGSILVDGATETIRSPQDAAKCGIGMVHQHFALVPTLTVLENVELGFEHRRGPLLDRHVAAEKVEAVYELVGLPRVDSARKVGDLSVGEQQRVEIVKALAHGARILILDEPTAVLTPQEVDGLGKVLLRLRDEGYAIVFITHKLSEVERFCDRVTVLRRGRRVRTLEAATAGPTALAELMVGRDVRRVQVHTADSDGEEVLRLEGVTTAGHPGTKLAGVDLTARRGELLGICGVDGNGQGALGALLGGLVSPREGKMWIRGEPVPRWTAREAIKRGVAYVPEDRSSTGLVRTFSIKENLLLKTIDESPYRRSFGRIDWGAVSEHADRLVEQFDVRPPDGSARVSVLSGGNQQKVILARELTGVSDLIVVAEPTRGLDVGSIETIHSMLVSQREAGKAVVVISTDLDEILDLSDRVAVLFEGTVVAVRTRESANREELGLLMAGGSA